MMGKGVYDTATGSQFDYYYAGTSLIVLALGIYFVNISKNISGDQNGRND